MKDMKNWLVNNIVGARFIAPKGAMNVAPKKTFVSSCLRGSKVVFLG